jgi:hypothetical protein
MRYDVEHEFSTIRQQRNIRENMASNMLEWTITANLKGR